MAFTESSRTSHPFFMYDHIQVQPAAFADVIDRNRGPLAGLVEKILACRKLFLVGIGTSYHAAQIGCHLFRLYAPGVTCEVWHSFNFALYGPALSPDDVVLAVSHRGAKQFTLRSLQRAKQAGCTTAMITGQDAPSPPMKLDAVYETVEQEKSAAHTFSHVGAVGVLSELTRQVDGNASLDVELLSDTIPAALDAGLATEEQMARWAEEHQNSRRIWLIGGGPSAVTAHEAALKIKETSYLQAEGLSVETLLHGPFQCCEAEDLFVLIAPEGAAQPRMLELPGMIQAIGAKCVLVTNDAAAINESGITDTCVVPTVQKPFESLTCLLPLQLFTYHLALQCGTNPDSFRLDDPRFAAAMARVKL